MNKPIRKNAAKHHVMKPVKRGLEEWTMDKWLTGNLDVVLNKAIPNKWDCIFTVFGGEGSGKSTIGAQICKYLDPKFDLKKVVFTSEQFKFAVENSEPESSILWDESMAGATAGNQASKISKTIISLLTQIRFKRLKICLCFPYYNMLSKYFVMRCLFNVYVYATAFNKRGFFIFYTKTQSEFLYNLMKERFKYSYKGAIGQASHAFKGFFNAYFPLDDKKYNSKKENWQKKGDEKRIRICNHFFKARLKTNDWRCQICGEIVKINPFSNNDNRAKALKEESKNDKITDSEK